MTNNLLLVIAVLLATALAAFFGGPFVQLLLTALAGTICHYFVELKKQHTDCHPVDYFSGAFGNTLASLGGCVLAVFAIVQSGHDEISYLTASGAFTAGYMMDSALNKPP
jgi:predicted PurR-regulated permease PerM